MPFGEIPPVMFPGIEGLISGPGYGSHNKQNYFAAALRMPLARMSMMRSWRRSYVLSVRTQARYSAQARRFKETIVLSDLSD